MAGERFGAAGEHADPGGKESSQKRVQVQGGHGRRELCLPRGAVLHSLERQRCRRRPRGQADGPSAGPHPKDGEKHMQQYSLLGEFVLCLPTAPTVSPSLFVQEACLQA